MDNLLRTGSSSLSSLHLSINSLRFMMFMIPKVGTGDDFANMLVTYLILRISKLLDE